MRIALAIFLLSTLICCEPDEPNYVPAPDGSIKALLDARTLTTDGVSATLNNTTGEILQITANFPGNFSSTQLSISAYSTNTNDVINPGEYAFGSKNARGPYDGVCTYVLNDGNQPFSTTAVQEEYVGNVNITELNRTELYVSGTFEATVGRNTEVMSFTKGSFTKIPLTIN